REDLIERLLERDAVQIDGVWSVDEIAVERHIDAGQVADRRQDVADLRVDEANRQRIARGGIEDRERRDLPRLRAQLLDRRLGTRRLELFANRAVQLLRLRGGLTVGRIELRGLSVLAHGAIELPFLLEFARAIEMAMRRVEHGALQCDLVLGTIRRRL